MIDNYHKVACCFADKVNKEYEAKRFGISCHIDDLKTNKEEAIALNNLMEIVQYVNNREKELVETNTLCDLNKIKEKVNIL